MILKTLKYKNIWFKEWSIVSGTTNDEFVQFENINLIVGRNASGKTRLIEAIRWISDVLNEGINIESSFDESSFEMIFQENTNQITYSLAFNEQASIIQENLSINDVIKLDRGKGKLYYEEYGGFLDFTTEDRTLVVSRRDSLQQPFFEILHNWGKNLAHYSFGGNMGKDSVHSYIENQGKISFKNHNKVGVVYAKGKAEFESQFEQKIIDDMSRIEYDLTSISLNFETDMKYLFLSVKEKDLTTSTQFRHMSQGMARAFSLIVQLNYSLMAKIPSCILIDDIGEGLDYDRSKKLIELIIEKAEGSNIQIFMTTNDRFVMNSVPLKYWSVIHREGNKSVFYNYQNSKQTFDDFAFTGLNNFDFFATEFYRLGFEEFIATAQ
jgi:AAA15 family ATPase/GTPase